MKLKTLLLAFALVAGAVAHADKTQMEQNLTNYIATTYPCQVTNVEVTADKVKITGSCPADGQFALVDITPAEDATETTRFRAQYPIEGNQSFAITVDRKVTYDGIGYDRILSRWAIAETTTGDNVLASHARYADLTPALSSPAELIPSTKKGVGAGLGADYMNDVVELGAKNVTINLVLNNMIATSPIWSSNVEYYYQGEKYYINGDEIGLWDWHLDFYKQHQVAVSAIILITPTSVDPALTPVFRHPENTGGNYTMANMTNMKSINAYAAIINYLAHRYNGNGARIHHWIMHNEVDNGLTWTNMGQQPEIVYLDTYVKSMRLCYNIVRQYDQHASVLGSFTHNWTTTSGGEYAPRTMLEHIVQMSDAEGDFPWGVACHPYPQTLSQPKFWINDALATNERDSKYVTFKNLEIINEWILRPEHKYKGTLKRKLFLSENGTNSPSYTETELANQAAGGAWAWKKTNALPGIDAFMWHNWMDNRSEYGLRIGLRYYIDEESNPGGPKPVWHVWKAADTPDEDAVFAPYLDVIGIEQWKDIFMLLKGEGRELSDGNTYEIEAEDYDLGGQGIAYSSHGTTNGSDYRSDNDGVNLTAYSLLSGGMGIYDMGGDWQTYAGTFLDENNKTISRQMAEEHWGSWFTYTVDAKEDLMVNISIKHAAPWRDYGNAAATGCPPGNNSYIINDDPSLNWPKHYAGAMVVSLDGTNLYTTQTARPIAPDQYQSRGTNFNTILTHPDRWTSTLNGKEMTDTLWVWSRSGGNSAQSSFYHDAPDYKDLKLTRGKHTIKVKSLSSPWNFDCLRLDCYSMTSGITSPHAASPVIITGGKGCITLSGATGEACIYSLTGALVGRAQDTITLQPGIYIVKSGNTVSKVKVY